MRQLQSTLRAFRKSPGFAVTVILTIALGIGANTAIFTLVHAVLLRSLPVQDPHGLWEIGDNTRPGYSDGFPDPNNSGDFSMFSYELYKHVEATTPQLTEVAAMSAPDMTMALQQGDEQPRTARVEYVSGNYFSVLGIQPFAGRLLTPADDRSGAAPTGVLSYAAWQSLYGGSLSILGQTIRVQGHPFTVAGITPPGFFGDHITPKPPVFYIPLQTEQLLTGAQSVLHTQSMNWLNLLARLKPGTSVPALQQQLTANVQQWMRTVPAYTAAGQASQIAKQYVRVVPGGRGILTLQTSEQTGLYLLMGLCLLVLLVACANVANLLLARGTARRGDTALRVALGAARTRIVSQMMTESILLALAGGVAGVAVAYAGTRLLVALAFPNATQLPVDPHPSLPVLGFAFALSLVTGLLFGVAPALINSHADPAEALRGANRSTRDRNSLPQRWLVIFQAALSLVLLVGAGLLTRSLDRVEHQDFGIDTHNRYLVQFDPEGAGYTVDALPALYREIEQRFAAQPDVRHVAVASWAPLHGSSSATGVFLPGRRDPEDNGQNLTLYDRVSPQYFAAIGQHVLAGRVFTSDDTENSQPVAVVNEAFVRRYYPGRNVIGLTFGANEPQMVGALRIVGVVADSKYWRPKEKADPMFFVDDTQQMKGYTVASDVQDEARSMFLGTLVLDYSSPPANVSQSVRQTLENIHAGLAPSALVPFSYAVQGNFDEDRLLSRLTLLFGALALVVAAVGLYGITAYQVARRTSEIGVRMALGATRGDMMRMVLRVAYAQVGFGILIGIPAAVLGAFLLRSQLYDTSALDPLSLLVAVAALAVAATLAALAPARRAATIEPVIALRSE